MGKLTYIQEYEITDQGIQIIAASGNIYVITETSCTCKGFLFRKTCGHHKEAKEKGLFDLLHSKPSTHKTGITLSDKAIALRKDAIKQYLDKNDITYDETIICELETIVTQDMKPQEFLEIAKKIGKLAE